MRMQIPVRLSESSKQTRIDENVKGWPMSLTHVMTERAWKMSRLVVRFDCIINGYITVTCAHANLYT